MYFDIVFFFLGAPGNYGDGLWNSGLLLLAMHFDTLLLVPRKKTASHWQKLKRKGGEPHLILRKCGPGLLFFCNEFQVKVTKTNGQKDSGQSSCQALKSALIRAHISSHIKHVCQYRWKQMRSPWIKRNDLLIPQKIKYASYQEAWSNWATWSAVFQDIQGGSSLHLSCIRLGVWNLSSYKNDSFFSLLFDSDCMEERQRANSTILTLHFCSVVCKRKLTC